MSTYREYKYIGSKDLRDKVPEKPERYAIQSLDDILEWIHSTKQRLEDGQVIATFIIDTHKTLYINDRRSEHVLCAAGQNVLSAGEITFYIEEKSIEVVEVTNQSTGYCPEPESWVVVDEVLNKLHILHPPDFTLKFIFRQCEKCQTKNIVKNEWFFCGVCDAPLSESWNFD
jgi:hypothetical protein